jgi:LysR family transcriptional activator of nhaA
MIAKEGSISAASKKLSLSQPAMSHSLSQLEFDIGKKLFDRVGRRLLINKDGVLILKYAQDIFRKSDEMIEVMNSSSGLEISIIRVGITPSMSEVHVFDLLKPYMKESSYRLQVLQGDINELLDRLMDKDVDVIYCDVIYPRKSKKVKLENIKNTKIACYASPSVAKKLIRNFPKGFEDCKLITYSRVSALRQQVDSFLKKNKLTPKIFGEFSDSSLVRYVLENSDFVGFLPVDMAEKSILEKKLIMINEIKESSYEIWKYSLF